MSFVYNAPSSTTNYIGLGLYGGDAIRISAFTLPSTSQTTGALIVRGGLGISGATYSGSITATGSVTATTQINITSAATVSTNVVSFLAASLGASNGITTTLGVAATTHNSAVTQFVYNGAGSTTNYWGVGLFGSPFTLTATESGTVSTSTITGAVTVAGGLGVSGAINSASLALTTALPTTSGGTGLSTVGTNTQVLTSNGTTLFWSTLGGGGSGNLSSRYALPQNHI